MIQLTILMHDLPGELSLEGGGQRILSKAGRSDIAVPQSKAHFQVEAVTDAYSILRKTWGSKADICKPTHCKQVAASDPQKKMTSACKHTTSILKM
jgi:hypothetical protein